MGEKILILSFSGIGNSLMAAPFLNCLRQKINPAQIDILCLNHAMGEAFKLVFDGGKVYSLSGGITQKLTQILSLRRKKYDYCVTIFPSNKWQFDIIAFLSGAKNRISHTYRINRFSAFLQNIKIPAEDNLHDVEQNLRLLKAFGQGGDDCCRGLTFHFSEADNKFAENFLAANIPERSFLVGMHPGAGSDYGGQSWQGRSKRWSEDNFAVLCDRLIEEKNARIILFGGKNELNLKNSIKTHSCHSDKVFLAHTLTLAQAAALIGRCKLFISNDSGLMHLAAFMCIPVLGIFGPTNCKRTAPCGEKSFYIRSEVSCAPCLKYPFYSTSSKLRCRDGLRCFDGISVEEVVQFLKKKGLV
jgi:heptosyltransferase-2